MAPTSPDLARFGVAMLRDAEESRADDQHAAYLVDASLEDIIGFYTAIYGQTKGVVLEPMPQLKPPGFAVAVGPKCQEAEFSMILVRKTPDKDKPRQHEILVLARGADDLGGYPDSSPWMQPR